MPDGEPACQGKCYSFNIFAAQLAGPIVAAGWVSTWRGEPPQPKDENMTEELMTEKCIDQVANDGRALQPIAGFFETQRARRIQADGEDAYEIKGKTAKGKIWEVEVTASGKVLDVE